MTLSAKCAAKRYTTLAVDVRDEILTVTITRPEVLNALSPTVISELRDLFGALRTEIGSVDGAGRPEWSIRGVILTGAGEKSFVAGADIAAMRGMSPAEASAYATDAHELTLWIETLAVPVVAAVNGFALGGGCEIALACDYILATERASFGQPEVALGLIPGFGGCVRLQQLVGPAAASEMIFTGRRITAAEAVSIGLVLRVLPDTGSLLAAAHDSLRLAAENSPVAVANAKRTLRAVHAQPTAAGLAVEGAAFASCFGTADMVEGTTAFVEKRAAVFPG